MACWHRLIVAAAIGLALTSCQADRDDAAGSIDLSGTVWAVESIVGRDVTGEPPPFLRFDDDRQLSGNAGCNNFTGSYENKDGRLVIGPLAITRMLCRGEANEQERRFMAALSDIDRYEIEDDLLLIFATGADTATRLAPKVE